MRAIVQAAVNTPPHATVRSVPWKKASALHALAVAITSTLPIVSALYDGPRLAQQLPAASFQVLTVEQTKHMNWVKT